MHLGNLLVLYKAHKCCQCQLCGKQQSCVMRFKNLQSAQNLNNCIQEKLHKSDTSNSQEDESPNTNVNVFTA